MLFWPALLLACSSSKAAAPCSDRPELPDAGPVHITGTVTAHVNGTPSPLPNAVVAVEYGGLYVPYCDLSHASPFYIYGAVTDESGSFTIDVAPGTLGFHGFANGQYYARASLDTTSSTAVAISMVNLPSSQSQPTITGAAFDKATVAPGGDVTVRATVRAATPSDPLSDETILVEPTHSWATELDPPSVGAPDRFPDGTWSHTFAAPMQPGDYTYWLAATTGKCVTSELATLALVVQ